MSINGRSQSFQGALIAFVGDTPAVNKVGGFKESVSQALRKCRHCMAMGPQLQTQVRVCMVF